MDLIDIFVNRFFYDFFKLHILLHEFGPEFARQPEQIIYHQHLAVAVSACADADTCGKNKGPITNAAAVA